MVRHNLKGIQVQAWMIAGKVPPQRMHQLACLILYHLILHHIPQQTEPILRADRYGICAGRRIIVAAKPDRPAVMNFGVVFHL